MNRRRFMFLSSAAAGVAVLSTAARALGIAAAEAPLQPAMHPSHESVRPFTIAVPRAQLIDLQERLAKTRWPDRETVDSTVQGPPLADIRRLVQRWRNGYDWRSCERLLNSLGQHVTQIDGLDIHFLHIRAKEPNALPLLLTHGWPGSVLEFRHIIGPLTDPVAHGGKASDAFDIILPSLPGHGFSGKPTTTGWNNERIAKAWIVLMERLGYERWVAQGGDRGAQITTRLGYMQPRGLIGMHINLVEYMPTETERSNATAAEQKILADMQFYLGKLSGYYAVQSKHPQAIAYSVADSPVGQAAWIYQMLQDVSDSNGQPEKVFELDDMIDDIMLYWLPNAAASSARLYWETAQEKPRPVTIEDPMPVPTGISMFPGEKARISERWAAQRFAKLVHFNDVSKGGHFAAWEQPAVFVDEMRATFRTVR